MQRLSIYVTPGHSSVAVQNGVSRETSGPTVSQVIDAMPEPDRLTLLMFCQAVAEYVQERQPAAMNALELAIRGNR